MRSTMFPLPSSSANFSRQEHQAQIEYIARTPQHRFGEPAEIARAVAWLADDAQSSFVTGTTLTVDGGWSAR